ncbi:dnaJ homolog subfamily C member 4-like [Bolinopsis microptera]|uniref:dnaJ homolog subfamily C member 4-like n=1 Tax=Bolinopsis microptera TaxID=2820187 RepID=UPI003078D568
MIRYSLCRGYCRQISQQIRLLSSSHSHYERLDIKRDASKKDIKSAYFTKAKQCHPDLYPDNPTKAEEYLHLQDSYNILMSSESDPSDHSTPAPMENRTDFAQEIDKEFLKSVWRDPIARDKTGLHLNTSLLSPSTISHYINKSLNVVVCGCVAAVVMLGFYQYMLWVTSGDETEEERRRREEHAYYRNLNQSRAITQRLPESVQTPTEL